uniref:Agglutinin C-terminal domain-containing protein n=1 Tax=viral metagenome TaxID=1070528 RepID=A0A6M3K8U7_9ZZZZ
MQTLITKVNRTIEIANSRQILASPTFSMPKMKSLALYGLLHSSINPGIPVYLSDKDYDICPKSKMIAVLALDLTNKFTYAEDEYDCDDFAYRLMGQLSVPGWADIAFGVAWSSTHAFNVYCDGSILYYIEPQTDILLPFEKKESQYYPLRFLTM